MSCGGSVNTAVLLSELIGWALAFFMRHTSCDFGGILALLVFLATAVCARGGEVMFVFFGRLTTGLGGSCGIVVFSASTSAICLFFLLLGDLASTEFVEGFDFTQPAQRRNQPFLALSALLQMECFGTAEIDVSVEFVGLAL